MKLYISAFIFVYIVKLSRIQCGPPPFCTNWNTNITSVCRTIAFFHDLLAPIVRRRERTLRHCDFLRYTPHCCEQFCIPAKGSGTCEKETGVCRCSGAGKPEMCNTHFRPKKELNKLDTIFENCSKKCLEGPKSDCQTPAYIVDGYNCICYCDKTNLI